MAVRCGVCREKDWWWRGGPGRAELIGYLTDEPQRGGVLLEVRLRHGFVPPQPYRAGGKAVLQAQPQPQPEQHGSRDFEVIAGPVTFPPATPPPVGKLKVEPRPAEVSPTDPWTLDWRSLRAHEGFRVKCRYGHHLWVSAERFGQLFDRTLGPDNTLYLPG